MSRLSGQLKRTFAFTLNTVSRTHPLGRPFLFKKTLETKRVSKWTPLKKWVAIDQAFLLVQGPSSLTMNWIIQKETRDMVALHFGTSWRQLIKKIRLHDVTDLIFTSGYSHKFLEVEIPEMTDNWHFHQLESNRSYIAEYGVGLVDDQFLPLFRTNSILTPVSLETKNEHNQALEWKEIDKVSEHWHKQFSAYTMYD